MDTVTLQYLNWYTMGPYLLVQLRALQQNQLGAIRNSKLTLQLRGPRGKPRPLHTSLLMPSATHYRVCSSRQLMRRGLLSSPAAWRNLLMAQQKVTGLQTLTLVYEAINTRPMCYQSKLTKSNKDCKQVRHTACLKTILFYIKNKQ